MKKCNNYPHCDCYNDWVNPALEFVSEKKAELFAEIMKEIENFCDESKFITFEELLPYIENYKEILPAQLINLFSDRLITMLDFHYQWKMPKPTDINKIEINLPKIFLEPNLLNLTSTTQKGNMGNEETFIAASNNTLTEYETIDENLKSFEGLEDYIIKNVSGDRKANLERLKQLKSNLLGWQPILIKLKGKPLHSIQNLEQKRQASITKLETIIDAALKDLDFRISREVALPKGERFITVTDKILRELDIIESIFKAQYSEEDAELLAYPTLLNESGKSRVPGRYINWMNIYSDEELFNIQKFKDVITNRFEQTSNVTLITNQLNEIYKKAIVALQFYNGNLTDKNKIVKDFLEITKQPIDEREKQFRHHSAVINVNNYYISEIYFGTDFISLSNQTENVFNYLSNNGLLKTICQSIISFIDKFTLPTKDNLEASNPPIDPLSNIDPMLHQLFFEKESKAKNKNNQWDTKIKCAAFCELLWNNKYLGEKKERIKKCNDFAKGRYGIDISVQLDRTKKPDREKHKKMLAYIFK